MGSICVNRRFEILQEFFKEVLVARQEIDEMNNRMQVRMHELLRENEELRKQLKMLKTPKPKKS